MVCGDRLPPDFGAEYGEFKAHNGYTVFWEDAVPAKGSRFSEWSFSNPLVLFPFSNMQLWCLSVTALPWF